MASERMLCRAFAVRAFLVSLCVLAGGGSVSAQAWRMDGDTAGFANGSDFAGLSFRCLAAGKVRMAFSGFPQRLQPGHGYTVALSIDGTASLYDATAAKDGASLVVDQSSSDIAPVVELLRKGKAAEVSGPAGRYVVPLKGSGTALAAFGEHCG